MPDTSRPPSWLRIEGSPKATSGRAAARKRSRQQPVKVASRSAADAKRRAGIAAAPPANGNTPADDLPLSANARVVLERRYLAKDGRGRLAETPEQLFRRVAHNIAQAEAAFAPAAEAGVRIHAAESRFYDLMSSLRFLPNSPTLGNAGRPIQQLAACFVLPVEDSMEGIFDSLKDTALIHQSGGGTGFAFSRLRPAGDVVSSTGGIASGPVSFMRVYDAATESIKQGGTRRGANMAILSVDHPDIESFINVKADMTTLTNFNISVAVTETFMRAVQKNQDYDLLNPRTKAVVGRRNAREVFRQIVANAWRNGDPGLVFLDRINRDNPTPALGQIEATNPCVTGDTRIATASGLRRMDDLHGTGEDVNVVADRRGVHLNALGTSERAALPVFQTHPDAEVFRVMTTHGYEIAATAYHTFVTPRGRVELRDLKAGDTLFVQSGEGGWGSHGSADLGLVLGTLAGDGNFHRQRGVVLSFWGDGIEYAPVVEAAVGRLLAGRTPMSARASMTPALLPVASRNRADLRSVELARLLAEYGVTASTKLRVPEVVWQGTRDMVAAYLRALFGADGTVNHTVAKKSCSVRLAQSDRAFLGEIQVILANFGIESRIRLRRAAGARMMPDGRGGQRLYAHKAQYDLIIDGASRDLFARDIGFLCPRKQALVEAFISGKSRLSNASRFETKVLSVEPAGRAAVYDTTEPATHTVTVNGMVTGQCGEQPLLPYESCNLGSINLSRFTRPVRTRGRSKNGAAVLELDWDALAAVIPDCVRFLDDVIEMNRYPIPEIEAMTKQTRKIGLGLMGWADLLFRLRIRYDSDDAIALAQRVAAFIQEHADRSSRALAEERGTFPAWEASIYGPTSKHPRRNTPLRNSTRTTIAPTGTLSIIADCSGGIEPAFALAFMRQHHLDRKDPAKVTRLPEVNATFEAVAREHGFHSDELMEYLAEGGALADRDDVPAWAKDVFRTSHDIDPEWHVRMQAAFQRHTDNAVSKTINFRHDATVEDVERAYILAYREGCKGITVYRDGSRDLQVLSHATARGPEQAEAAAAEVALGISEELAAIGAHPAPVASLGPRPAGAPYRRHLPDERQSVTHKFRVGEQEGYVTVGLYDDGSPGEIFVNISKEGSTIRGLMDSVAVLTSVALQYGVPLRNLVEKFRGVHFEPAGLTNNPAVPTASSLVDYIFRWLESRFLPAEPPPAPAAKPRTQAKKAAATPAKPVKRAQATRVNADPPIVSEAASATSTGIGCPQCGSILVFGEGCFTCRNCGFTRC